MQFAEVFPEFEIVVPLARQSHWSDFLILIPLKNSQYPGPSIRKEQVE